MRKNVSRRLEKLENELQAVLSLYKRKDFIRSSPGARRSGIINVHPRTLLKSPPVSPSRSTTTSQTPPNDCGIKIRNPSTAQLSPSNLSTILETQAEHEKSFAQLKPKLQGGSEDGSNRTIALLFNNVKPVLDLQKSCNDIMVCAKELLVRSGHPTSSNSTSTSSSSPKPKTSYHKDCVRPCTSNASSQEASKSKPRTLLTKKKSRQTLKNKESSSKINVSLSPEGKRKSETALAKEQLRKLITKKQERVEEMKRAKDVAVNIAKHLKDTNDLERENKRKLNEKVAKLEAANSKLSYDLLTLNKKKEMLESDLETVRKKLELRSKSEEKLKTLCEAHEQLKTKYKTLEDIHMAEQQDKDRLIASLKKSNEETQQIEELKQVLKEETTKNVQLETKIYLLENKVAKFQEEERKIFQEVKRRVKKEKTDLLDEAKKVSENKAELQQLVAELTQLAQQHQKRTNDTEEEFEHQSAQLKMQAQELEVKKEQLEVANSEVDEVKQRAYDLENQVHTLRKTLEELESLQDHLTSEKDKNSNVIQEKEKTIQEMEKELSILRADQSEVIKIKDKIIEDQQNTIQSLKIGNEQLKVQTNRNESLERVLETERTEKLLLKQSLQEMTRRKEELKKKVKSLEHDLLRGPEEVVQDLKRTQVVLHELEMQVQKKQKEWEEQIKTLLLEKEKACYVAEFATRKLMQSTNEFQQQTESQKRLNRILVKALADRPPNIMNQKVSNQQLLSAMNDLHKESKQMSKAMRNHRCVQKPEEFTSLE